MIFAWKIKLIQLKLCLRTKVGTRYFKSSDAATKFLKRQCATTTNYFSQVVARYRYRYFVGKVVKKCIFRSKSDGRYLLLLEQKIKSFLLCRRLKRTISHLYKRRVFKILGGQNRHFVCIGDITILMLICVKILNQTQARAEKHALRVPKTYLLVLVLLNFLRWSFFEDQYLLTSI